MSLWRKDGGNTLGDIIPGSDDSAWEVVFPPVPEGRPSSWLIMVPAVILNDSRLTRAAVALWAAGNPYACDVPPSETPMPELAERIGVTLTEAQDAAQLLKACGYLRRCES